jgi:tRNA dimethylallyltransferase
VAGEITLGEARALIVIETRQYAKRQRTWFRHQLPAASVCRVDPAAPDAEAVAEAWWRGSPHPHEEPA